MTIREIEARCQMERANIRFYEREGLLTAQRLPNGYRDYTEEDVQTLLRIRVYSAKDYHDKFDGDYFQLIGQKGLFEYYAYVLPSQSELAITQQELTGEMFFFLD